MQDNLGNEVDEGDRIAVAMRQGNHAYIRIGLVKNIVAGFEYNQAYEDALVEWETIGGYMKPNAKATRIRLTPDRVVKIG